MASLRNALLAGIASWLVAGCSSFDDYAEDLKGDDQEDRIDAANDLAEAWRDRDADVRERAPEAMKALRAALADKSALVRQVAIEAYAEVAAKRAVGPIADRLRDQDPWVRYAAVRQLGRLRATTAREALESLLARDRDDDVRRAAVAALREARDPASAQAFYLGLGDPQAGVRYQCAQGLRELFGQDLGIDPQAWRAVMDK